MSPPSSRAGSKRPATVNALGRFRRLRGQQRDLDPLGESQLLLNPFFVAPYLFVQPGVVDRDRGLTRQQRQQFFVLLGERVELGALQIEHTEAAILDEHRDHELGSRVVNEIDVARILGHVGDEHGLLVQGRPSDEALTESHVLGFGALAVAHGELHFEVVGRLVKEQDAERSIIDQPLGQARDSREQGVEVEDRRHLASDLGQRFERVDVMPFALEEPCVFECDGHVRAKLS
jgi:hypothetical protein